MDTPETLTPRQNRLVMIPGGRPNLDQPAVDAAAHADARGLPLMLRLQPELYFANDTNKKAAYISWYGVIWKGEFASAEALVDFREAMQGFIEAWFLEHGGTVATLPPEGDNDLGDEVIGG